MVETARPDDAHVAVQSTPGRRRVVIIGGGFGGLQAARALRWADVDVVLVDRRNHHVFQPLLYQVATAGLSPGDIAAPIRWILRRQQNVQVLLGEALRIDRAAAHVLHLDIGQLHYDALIIATGATHAYFGHDDWQAHAPGLKTLEDAGLIRRHLLLAFEQAERTPDQVERARHLTFVIVGGGPTGVELAGALAELANYSLARDFRSIDTSSAQVIVVEAGPRILSAFPEDLQERARSLVASARRQGAQEDASGRHRRAWRHPGGRRADRGVDRALGCRCGRRRRSGDRWASTSIASVASWCGPT